MSSKKPSIALIGNMNNNFYAIQRLLLKEGFEPDLFQFSDEPEHFHPSMDTFSDSWRDRAFNFPVDSDPTNLSFLSSWRYRFHDRVRRIFQKYDVLIGCGIAPSVVERLGMNLRIFIPYGSDFYELPFGNEHGWFYESLVKATEKVPPSGILVHWLCQFGLIDQTKYFSVLSRHLQRRGIENCGHIFFFGAPADFKAMESKLGIRHKCHEIPIPAVVPSYYETPDEAKKSKYFEAFEQIRDASDFVLFHHSRHAWANPPNRWTRKNNDYLLKGFAEFLNRCPAHVAKPTLITLEYGPDVAESKKLVSKLGIDEHVRWFPQMSRRDLMAGLRMADIGVVEFGHTWLTGGTLFEFLSQGVPVMQRFDASELESDVVDSYPMIVANTVEEIAQQFLKYATDKSELRRIGDGGSAWYQRNVTGKFLSTLKDLIA